jgi:hypothetical protein
MLTELFSFGKYMFIITSYAVENHRFLISAYSIFDMSKFVFYVSDRMGIVDMLKKRINDQTTTNYILIEFQGVEKGNLGDFEIYQTI